MEKNNKMKSVWDSNLKVSDLKNNVSQALYTVTNFLLIVAERELLFKAILTLTLLELKVISFCHWSVQTKARVHICALK